MKNNLFDLSGQVAFCCGGSSGLGLQFAKAMANAGADIALVARRTDRLDENAREIEAEYGVKVYPHYMDLQDSKSITDCVSDVVAHFGKIDILVNAAGIPGGGDPATLTDEYWLNVINTDLNGQFFTCREVVRQSMSPISTAASSWSRPSTASAAVRAWTRHRMRRPRAASST